MDISPELLSKLILDAYKQGVEEGKKIIQYVPYVPSSVPWTISTTSPWGDYIQTSSFAFSNASLYTEAK